MTLINQDALTILLHFVQWDIDKGKAHSSQSKARALSKYIDEFLFGDEIHFPKQAPYDAEPDDWFHELMLSLLEIKEKNIHPVKLNGDVTNIIQSSQAALREAVATLYFDDNSDFKSALWTIAKLLGGEEAVDLLDENPRKAFEKYVSIE